MADGDSANARNGTDKSDGLAHWFLVALSLIYGSGCLIVFTFFKSLGVDSIEFVEAKYIHIGVLFVMACLVIAVPMWWVVWPKRMSWPRVGSTILRKGLLKRTWKGRLIYPFVE